MPSLSFADYHIYVDTQLAELPALAAAYSQVFVISDENTHALCLPLLRRWCPGLSWTDIVLPAGEVHKTIDSTRQIWQALLAAGADRKALAINLGGGVVGDMGGFAAATFKRGIDFVQVPTTLLSQVDASIGGKLGVDFEGVKNCVGVFENPKAVFIEPAFLATLPERELRSGFAEIVKHALISDVAYWKSLKEVEALSVAQLRPFILRSLEIKKQICEADPYEAGQRKLLNFGHTIGHAIESYLLHGEQPVLHGEAVAAGMICEAWMSVPRFHFPKAALEEVAQFILQHFGKIKLDAADLEGLLRLMQQDKKNAFGQIRFSPLLALGSAQWDQVCSQRMIADALQYYRQLEDPHAANAQSDSASEGEEQAEANIG